MHTPPLSGPEPDAPSIAWLDWSPEAFARAAAERKPVLLNIGATWCHGCAVMGRTTYADPAIVRLVNERTVPVRVDADRRPDINDRYNLEGWPTTSLLTPSGEMLTGSTYVTPDVMPRMIAEAADALSSRFDELMARAAQAAALRRAPAEAKPARYEPDPSAPDWVLGRIVEEFDREHGGFGRGGKFLQPAALRLVLARYRAAGDPSMAGILSTTLDAMTSGGVFDAVDGGFYRYTAGRDWSRPHTEKMLEDQAALITLLIEAAEALDHPAYLERARDVIAYVQRTLSDRQRGGFFASQGADEDYYAVSASIRETLEAPVVDRTLFTDLNAQGAAAWLQAGAALGDVGLGRHALASIERVLLATYRPGQGVAHFVAGGSEIRGLLTDQVHAAWTLLDLDEATGNDTYGMLAEELMRTAMRTLWDEHRGGFRDRPAETDDAIGLLADPVFPLPLNCLAARVLVRLADRSGQVDFEQFARATLASLTGVYRRHGIGGAPYALAVLALSA
jgi:uncharacterized protein YyaL (SSP411 family)